MQKRIETRIENLHNATTGSHRGLVRIYRRVASAIENANYEFEERAYAPFWDLVERAAILLAQSKNQSEAVARDFKKLADETKKLQQSKMVVQLEIKDFIVPDFAKLANELRLTVRKAQKDFEFSTIYEQRRANRILVEGFSTLGNTIEALESRLSQAIGKLNRDIQEGFNNIQASQRKAAFHIANSIDSLSESNSNTLSEIAESLEDRKDAAQTHEERVEDMLDNIQRRRKPL